MLAAYEPGGGLSQPLFRFYMVVAALGTVLAAGYLLWLLQRVAFGTPTEEFENEHIHDMHLTDYLAWAPMIALILVLGVYPNLLFKITDGAVVHSLRAFTGS
jgi:NADH-quinone oxidoreductase subunit M